MRGVTAIVGAASVSRAFGVALMDDEGNGQPERTVLIENA